MMRMALYNPKCWARGVPLLERFMEKTMPVTESGCTVWIGTCTKNGYGQFRMNGRLKQAHRVAYELLNGPIPSGLTIDHLCKVTCCVNPAHLEAVTQRANVLRGVGLSAMNARKTHCLRGHELTEKNTYLRITPAGGNKRKCRTCRMMQKRQRAERDRVRREHA